MWSLSGAGLPKDASSYAWYAPKKATWDDAIDGAISLSNKSPFLRSPLSDPPRPSWNSLFALFAGHVSSVYWDEFCAVVNKDLKQLSSVRTVIFRIILLYIVVMVALYLVFEYFKLFGELFMTSLLVEALVSVGILFAVIFLYILKVRVSVIGSIKRHVGGLNKNACPRLQLRCHLPFFQFTGGIAKGWYISVKTRTETA